MKLSTHEFLLALRAELKEKNLELDSTVFDFDSFDAYLDNCGSDCPKIYFSVHSTSPYFSVSFEIDSDADTIVLVASNGYDNFPIGKPKSMACPGVQKQLINLISNLIS